MTAITTAAALFLAVIVMGCVLGGFVSWMAGRENERRKR